MVQGAKLKVRRLTAERKNFVSKEDWVRAAIDTLISKSVEHVKVEPLAKALGVTKGSFYWHFKDRNALLEAVLEYWVERQTLAIIRRVNSQEKNAATKLRLILELPSLSAAAVHGADVELAIRAWARRSARARTAIDSVDAQRLAYLGQIFLELGFSKKDAQQRAMLAYSFVQTAGTVKAESQSFLTQMADFVQDLLIGKSRTVRVLRAIRRPSL